MVALKRKWTPEEVEALEAGVDKHGTGKWKIINEDPDFRHSFGGRSNRDLKDKWRSMLGRTVKASAATIKVPKTPASISQSPSSPSTTKDAEDKDLDPTRVAPDGKSAPRHHLEVEALSNTIGPNGADIGAISSFIQEDLNKGAWTATEDRILSDYINTHGEGDWGNVPTKAGLKRCGENCEQRWLSHLRPGIKSGNISSGEEGLIIRTANEIKNHRKSSIQSKEKKTTVTEKSVETRRESQILENHDKSRGSTDHCMEMDLESGNGFSGCPLEGKNLSQNCEMDCYSGENCFFSEICQLSSLSSGEKTDDILSLSSDDSWLFLDEMLKSWPENDVPSDLQSLVNALGSDEARRRILGTN